MSNEKRGPNRARMVPPRKAERRFETDGFTASHRAQVGPSRTTGLLVAGRAALMAAYDPLLTLA